MIARHHLTIRGVVQGVGFRPFVYRLAQSLALSGWVRNDGSGVSIEAQGDRGQLAILHRRLQEDLPPQAKIDSINWEEMALAEVPERSFSIMDSEVVAHTAFEAAIGADVAVCRQCQEELFDPGNRRYRYAFINCTDCGPRYTITRHLPYARQSTSMAVFEQCKACSSEYTDPLHRRFHAEPNACSDCGPQLRLLDHRGLNVDGDPVAEAVARLKRGEIVAIKGLGGFHLACDAWQPDAVARLRARKQREEKPLAVMFANILSILPYANVTTAEAEQLTSAERPIVLLEKLAACNTTFPEIAPGVSSLGAMLPYTPLHYLLFHAALGNPAGTDWLREAQMCAWVMTSANPHGEPLVLDNEEALSRLDGIADAFLLHNRDIVARCDDSVLRVQPSSGLPQFVRRARGYTPRAIKLAQHGPDVLALGGLLKNTACFTRRNQAFISPHIGDLDGVTACLALEETVEHLRHVLTVSPQAVAHDSHPDYFSTRLALQLADAWSVPAIPVQHHHAHIAAILAEHGVDEPVLGLALDGFGWGSDGSAWGGELLKVDGARCERVGHLRTLAMPGGDRAAQEPWRMAAATLHMMDRTTEISHRFSEQPEASALAMMLQRHSHLPMTSSMGRWFDAAAGLLGVQARMSFEGQAAMRLESLAAAYGSVTVPAALHELDMQGGQSVLDLLPLMRHISAADDAGYGAACFHAGLVDALADWVVRAAQCHGVGIVACGGGCFLNELLVRGLRSRLQQHGLKMLEALAVPPGDGGISLGQAWVARAQFD